MSIVCAPMHFAASQNVNPGYLLVENRCLARTILGIRHRRHRQLANRNETVECLVPIGTL